MARKKDSRSRRNDLIQQRNRRNKRRSTGLGKFQGQLEPLEKRELLAGDSVSHLDPVSVQAGQVADSQTDLLVSAQSTSLPAPPPAVYTALIGELNSTQTKPLASNVKSLDVSGIASDLIVTVTKGGGNKNTISVQKMAANGTGTGGIATYQIENDGGSLDNLVAGNQNQKVKILLNGKLDLLELTKTEDFQFAMGKKATSDSLLTKPTWIQVVQQSKGELDTLEIGQSGKSTGIELILGRDIRIDTLAKGTSFSGKLDLHFPDKNTTSNPEKLVDFALTPPQILGVGSLNGFDASSFLSVKAGDGSHQLKAGDQTVHLLGGDADDILIGAANAQVLDGDAGKDRLMAGGGDDTLRGGADADQLSGGSGNDTLQGGSGDDVYQFGQAGATDQNEWGTDQITETEGDNVLDFANIHARLSVVVDGNDIAVTSTKKIDGDAASGLSFGSDGDAVVLQLGASSVPTATISNGVVSDVSATTLVARMIVGSARNQISVASPTATAVDTRIDDLSQRNPIVRTNLQFENSAFLLDAGGLAIAFQDAQGDWTHAAPGTRVTLSDLLPTPDQDDSTKSLDDTTNTWSVAPKTLTFAIGDFGQNNTADFEAAKFELAFFTESEWTSGFTGSAAALEAQVKQYLTGARTRINAAATRATIVNDSAKVNEITEEVWLESIESAVKSTFSLVSGVQAEVLPRASNQVLSVSLSGHTGDIAIAPTTVSLPASLSTDMPQQQVSGTAHISRFIAPKNDNAQVSYQITSLTRDLEIQFDGQEAKSSLDVSALTDPVKIEFTGPGEVLVVVGTGNTAKEISAAGISEVIVGNGDKTFVFHQAAGQGQTSIKEVANATGDKHLVFGTGFANATVVVNNDAATWTLGNQTFAAKSMEFQGVDFVAPNIGGVNFASVTAQAGFLGNLQVNGVDVVETGKGNDTVQQTVQTPQDKTIQLGAGDDRFDGDDLKDVADGGDGQDVLDGHEGDDTLYGGAGDDQLIGGTGNDTLSGGPDNDTYQFSATWGVDSIVEEKGEGKSDVIDLSAVSAPMVHVITGNNYHGFTGSNHIQASQDLLLGSVRSAGKVQIKSGSAWEDFEPTNTDHIDSGANRVSVTDEKFQNIEGIKTSAGNNTFYFGNDWGPDAYLATAASSILPGVSALNRDRTLEIDTSQVDELVLDFRQVTDELKFTFEREEDGSVSLTVVKTDGLTIPFLDAEILEDGDVESNEIKFTKVDANTTIYGGREANTFALDGDATFDGTLIGGEGFRDWVGAPDTDGLTTGEKALEWAKFIFEKVETLHTLLGGELPDIFVSNKIDYTDAAPFVASGQSAWEVATSGLKSLFHSVRLREVGNGDVASSVHQQGWHDRDHGTQSLVFDGAVGSFKLSAGGTATALLSRSVSNADFNAALAALDFVLDSTTPGDGSSSSPYLIQYNGSGTPTSLEVSAFSDAAGTDANQLNQFGARWSKSAARPEIQTLWLDDVDHADSIVFTLGSTSVTWTKSGQSFDPADFHTANLTTTSPKLPLSAVSQLEGSGTESDPWQFTFDTTKGDLPQISVTVNSSGADTATATVQVQQDGENSLAEIQSFETPGYTFRLKFDAQSTVALPAAATPEQIAAAINDLSSLKAGESGRITVTGDGSQVSPFRVAFAEPGDRTLMTIEPAWLESVAGGGPKKFQLNLDAAQSGSFKLKYNSTESTDLGYRPTAAEVAAAVAAITSLSAEKISVVAVETTSRLTKAGSRFEIEIDDSALNAAGLEFVPGSISFSSKNVSQTKAGTDYAGADIAPVANIQQVRSALTSGTFVLQVGSRKTTAISFQATGQVVKNALSAVLGHDKFTVSEPVLLNGIRTWTISFDADLGEVLPIEAMEPSGGSQRAKGFATLRNIDSVDYGAGVNYLEGQNIDLESAAGSFEKLMENKNFFEFVEQLFGGGLQAGDDTFSVGGNVLTMARDYLVELASKKAGREESILDTLEEEYPFANTLLETALGPWFGGTVAPGAHILAGLTGADTYQFEGIYGAAAILEAPDIEVAGFAVPEGYDTLDLSGTDYDVTIDVYQAKLSDIPGIGFVLEAIPGLLGHENMPLLDVTSNVMIVRDGAISEKLGDFTLGAVDSGDIFGGEAGNVILALDIENLVLGEGKTTIKMHGDASIQGTIATHDDGKLFLDYSEYTELLDVDAEGGVQWEIIPELEIVPEFNLGELTVEAVKYPGIQIEFGRASGVEGNRLMGLTQLIQVLQDWGVDTTSLTGFRPVDNAVTSIDRVTMPAGNAIVDADEGHIDSGGIAWHALQDTVATVTDVDSVTKDLSVPPSGYFSLTYGGTAATPLAVSSTGAQVQSAINSAAGGTTVSVSGTGSQDNPWRITKNSAAVTLGTVGATGATLTSTETTKNSAYTLAYSSGGNIELQFGGRTETVNINNATAIETALETITGWDATVTSGTDEYTITLALEPLVVSASGVGNALLTEVSSLSDQLSLDASVGVFRLDYGGSVSTPLAHNATGPQVASAINAITGVGSVAVSGAGTTASPWTISRVANPLSISDAGSTSATLTSGGITNDSYTLTYSNAGEIDLRFQSSTQSVEVSDKEALQTAIEALTGMSATITTASPGNWSITLALRPLAVVPTGTGAIAMQHVDAEPGQAFSVNANAGVFSLQYGTTASDPLAFNATAEQVQDTLNRVTGAATMDVTGEGTAASPWRITQAKTEISIASDPDSTDATITATNADKTAYTFTYDNTGNVTLAYGGKTLENVSVATSTALETALETLTGTEATVSSSGAKSYAVTLALKTVSTTLTSVQIVPGITAGLMTVTKPAENANTGLANVSEVVLGSDDKLLFGSSGDEEDDKFTVIVEDSIGQSLVVGDRDEPIQILIGDSLRNDDDDPTITEKHFGGVSIYYVDASHYVIAIQTKQIPQEKDKLKTKLASNWAPSAIEVGIDAIKAELGNLQSSEAGTGSEVLALSVASARLTEAVGLWDTVSGITVSPVPELVIEDLPGTELAYFDAITGR